MWTKPFEVIGMAVWVPFIAVAKTILMVIIFIVIFIICTIKFLFRIGRLLR